MRKRTMLLTIGLLSPAALGLDTRTVTVSSSAKPGQPQLTYTSATTRSGSVTNAYTSPSPDQGSPMFEPGLKSVGALRVPDIDQRISFWVFHYREEVKEQMSIPLGRNPVPAPASMWLAAIGLCALSLTQRSCRERIKTLFHGAVARARLAPGLLPLVLLCGIVGCPGVTPGPGGNNGGNNGGNDGGNNGGNNGGGTPPPGRMVHDSCDTPLAAEGGTSPFSTLGATTDGPDEPGACAASDYTHLEGDVWFCYTAQCSGQLLLSLCGSGFDTKMAVYPGCACPTAAPLACNDDGCGLSTASRIMLNAQAGDQFLIRVGGFRGAQGDGTLTIKCNDAGACGLPTAGDCLQGNGTPYCADGECCANVCDRDWYCCDVEWDDACAAQAHGFCNGQFEACASGFGDCSQARGGPGCGNEGCCQQVCESEPFCCLNRWDQGCADTAREICGSTGQDTGTDPGTDPGTDTGTDDGLEP